VDVVKGLGVYPFFFCVLNLEAAVGRDASECVSSGVLICRGHTREVELDLGLCRER
jgi:hypothetical protein